MKKAVIFGKNGNIIKTVIGSTKMLLIQAKNDESLLLIDNGIEIDDCTQKVINDKIVDKTSEEIEAERPPVVPYEQQRANIANEQLQDILNRLNKLEGK